MPGKIHLPAKRGNKFRAQKTRVGDIVFDSKGEAIRDSELVLMEKDGLISDLKRQVRFDFVVNGVHVAHFTADWTYRLKAYVSPKGKALHSGGVEQALVVEDYKSAATRKIRDYPIRKKLLKACFGIDLLETGT